MIHATITTHGAGTNTLRQHHHDRLTLISNEGHHLDPDQARALAAALIAGADAIDRPRALNRTTTPYWKDVGRALSTRQARYPARNDRVTATITPTREERP